MRRLRLLLWSLLLAPTCASGQTIVTLPNGARIVAVEARSTDHFGCVVLIRSDTTDEEVAPGLRSLLCHCLLLASTKTPGEAIAGRMADLADLETRLAAGVEEDHLYVGATGPSEGLDLALAILEDGIEHAAFPDEAVAVARSRALAEARERSDDILYACVARTRSQLFAHSRERVVLDEAPAIEAAQPADIAAAYAHLVVGSRVVVACVAPLPESEIVQRAGMIVDGLDTGVGPAPKEPPAHLPAGDVTEAHGGRFAIVMLGYRVPGPGDELWPAVECAQALLGGRSGRLARSGRVRQLASMADAVLVQSAAGDYLLVFAATAVPWRIEALRSTLAQSVASIAADVQRGAEFEEARRQLLGRLALRVRSPLGRAAALARAEMAGADAAAVAREPLSGTRSLTPSDLSRLAAEYLTEDHAAMCVVLPEGERRPGTTSFPELRSED